MKVRSYLKKLNDLSKSSEHLAAVSKATNSSNKVDLKKVNQVIKNYDRKMRLFQLVRIISYAKRFRNMVMVVGRLY